MVHRTTNDAAEEAQADGLELCFRARLDQIINMKHELVQLAGQIYWDSTVRSRRSTARTAGPASRPAHDRAAVAQAHLRAIDEGICERWVHDPYFQFFTGEEFFQHAFPHERSDLSHWRKRLGDKLELLLVESLWVAHEAGALRSQDLKRVTVDNTVQPKAITFPTDAKFLRAASRGSIAWRGGMGADCGNPIPAWPRPPR